MSDDILRSLLGSGAAGRVLDVATGRGDFLARVLENLKPTIWPGINVGLDHAPAALKAFKTAQPKAQAVQAPADCMPFPTDSFDLVSISNSLHHLPDPPAALQEMLRVLSPDGRLLIYEMVCDGQRVTQQTHVLLHHWWGRIDTGLGLTHRRTYERGELLMLVGQLKLPDQRIMEETGTGGDPFDHGTAEQLEGIITQYQKRASTLPEAASLHAEGEKLRERVRTVGFQSATQIIIIGRK